MQLIKDRTTSRIIAAVIIGAALIAGSLAAIAQEPPVFGPLCPPPAVGEPAAATGEDASGPPAVAAAAPVTDYSFLDNYSPI